MSWTKWIDAGAELVSFGVDVAKAIYTAARAELRKPPRKDRLDDIDDDARKRVEQQRRKP